MNDFYPQPSGLSYKEDFITPEIEQTLVEKIDQSQWRNDLKRRVQHYGYRYDYKAGRVSRDDYLGEFPDWLDTLAYRLVDEDIFTAAPD
ncbi:MAG: hypothetical protein ABJE63_17130 [Lentilitoribacter sp.]